MVSFAVDKYGPGLNALLSPVPVCPLGPGKENRELEHQLTALTVESAFAGQTIRDASMARCCLSGIWMLHNFLDQSHSISQDIKTAEGSYWHGIMHRREGDFSNAKYWFHRAGRHPIQASLGQGAAELEEHYAPLSNNCEKILCSDGWQSDAMVDLCEAAERGRVPDVEFIKALAMLEWQLLFDYCYVQAID